MIPIDLDLVELRCKLRGWNLIYRDTKEIRVIVPKRPGYAAAVITTKGDVDVHETGYTAASSLTAPRWTLERLLSEPPEGWRVVPAADPDTAVHVLAWGDEEDAPRAAFGFVEGYGLLVSMNVRSAGRDLARLAERHKAAADLALIFAEIAP